MAGALTEELRLKLNEAARVADEFTKIYYDHVDKKKSMEKLYMDNGLLVWNGNGFNGNAAIQKFYREVAPTEHTLTTIDAQPIIDQSVGSETFLIQVSGTVKIDGRRSKAFQQTFTITPFQNKYKIVTDCFRLQDGICGEIKLD